MLNLTKVVLSTSNGIQKRPLWTYINRVFNKLDEERRKKLGPDRTCAEWILRNGGAIRWVNSNDFVTDYNALPSEEITLQIQEVDASDSSIMHHGFDHFVGCKHINKITLHNCSYLEDPALGLLTPLDKSLKDLQVSQCHNISSEGLLQLSNLRNLKLLTLFALSNVKNLTEAEKALKLALPSCKIIVK